MMRRWVILNGLLAVIVLALAVQIARTWARTLPPVEARVPARVTDTPQRSGEGGGKRSKRSQAEKTPQTPAALVTAIVEKDLFDPSRTKPSEDTRLHTVTHETTPPPGITLVGVRMFGGDREGFILDATQANTQRRIRTGDTVGNFTVKSIRRNSVLLVSQAGDYVTLSLEVDKSKSAPAAPARPGRPQAGAPQGAVSPAAGVTSGVSPAAGVGAAPKPPGVAAGTAAAPAPQPPAPPAPGPAAPKPPSPNLPESVRQKLEQMRGPKK
jgi:hypothetical protein